MLYIFTGECVYSFVFAHVYSGSLFSNSNWFAFEDDRTANEPPTDLVASASPTIDSSEIVNGGAADDTSINEDKDLAYIVSSEPPEPKPSLDDPVPGSFSNLKEIGNGGHEKSPILDEGMEISESVELSPTLNSAETSDAAQPPSLSNSEVQVESEAWPDDTGPDAGDTSSSSIDVPADSLQSPDLTERESGTDPSHGEGEGTSNIVKTDPPAGTDSSCGPAEHEEKN